ncbi:hypothetical protein OAL67_00240 [bacterium]|nr:hypothetical protein [bacterium]
MPKPLSNKNQPKLKVSIRSREKHLFDGNVSTLTSINDTGEFDVLGYHANFVTLIKKYVLLDKGLSTQKKFEFDTAVLSVASNKVDVYVGFEEELKA